MAQEAGHEGLRPFVGRRRELRELLEITTPRVQLALITGISGAGKSWLGEECLRTLSAKGVPVGAADFRYGSDPDPVRFMQSMAAQLTAVDFSAFRAVLESYDRRLDSAFRIGPASPWEHTATVSVQDSQFHASVGDITALRIDSVHLNIPAEELQRIRDDRQVAATDAFRECLRVSEQTPVVVLLDSMDKLTHTDGAFSGSFLSWLWHELIDPVPLSPEHPLKFIIAAQEPLRGQRFSARLTEQHIKIHLDAFDEDDASAFLALACPSGLSPGAISATYRLTKRNPLCMALVAELLTSTSWDIEKEEAAFAKLVTTTLVAEYLMRRLLEAVPAKTATALRRAAVPRTCDEEVLVAVLGRERAPVRWLTSRPSLFAPSRDGGWRLHALVRDLLLADFARADPEGLRTCHDRLAQFFSGKMQVDWLDVMALTEFTYHAVRARPFAVQVVAERLSRIALRTRNSQLATGLSDAISGADRSDAASDPWSAYVQSVAAILAGHAATAAQMLRRIWDDATAPWTVRLMAASALATVAHRGGQLDEAEKWAARALELSTRGQAESTALDEAQRVVLAACFNDLGTVMRTQIRFEPALAMYHKAKEIGLGAATTEGRWEAAYATLYEGAVFTGGFSRFPQARAAFEEAESQFQELHDTTGVIMAIQRQGWLARMRGDVESALREHERAKGKIRGDMEPLLLGELFHSTGNVLRQCRRWDEAASDYAIARGHFTTAGAGRHLCILEKDWGELQVGLGKASRDQERIRTGVGHLQVSLQMRWQLHQEREASPVYALLGEAATELGEYGEARVALLQALDIGRETAVPINQARALAKLATLGVRSHDPLAGEWAAQAIATSRSSGERFYHYEAEGLAAEARLLGTTDPHAAAERLLRALTTACKYSRQKAEEMLFTYRGGPFAPEDPTVAAVISRAYAITGSANVEGGTEVDWVRSLLKAVLNAEELRTE